MLNDFGEKDEKENYNKNSVYDISIEYAGVLKGTCCTKDLF